MGFDEYQIHAHLSLCVFMDINLPESCLNIIKGPTDLHEL